MAGEYLESLGRTDLMAWSPEELATLIEVIVTAFTAARCASLGDDRRRGAVSMSESYMARLGARWSTTATRSCRSCRAPRSPGVRRRRLARLPRLDQALPRPTTEHELDRLERLAGRRHRHRLRHGVGVDIDIADGELASRLERLAREMLGDTPALRIGRAPKRLLVYRAADAVRDQARADRGARRSASSSSPSPSTRRPAGPYEWPEESPADAGRQAGCRRSTRPCRAPSWMRRWRCCRSSAGPAAGRRQRGRSRPHRRSARHARGDRRGARVHPQRRPRLRQLGPHRHGAQGRARRGRPGSVRRLVGAVGKDVPETTAKTWASLSPSASAPAPSTTTPWPAAGARTRRWC